MQTLVKWSVITVSALALISAVYCGLSSHYQPRNYNPASKDYQKDCAAFCGGSSICVISGVTCAWHLIHRNEKAIIAASTIGILIFTLLVALYTKGLIQEAKGTAQKELRAYVGVHDIFFKFKSDADHKLGYVDNFRLRFWNYGNTPARIFRTQWVQKKSPDSIHVTEMEDFGHMLLQPGQMIGRRTSLTLSNRMATFYTYIRISYQDVYDQWRVLRYCYVYRKQTVEEAENRFTPEGQYNGEDNYASREQAIAPDARYGEV